MKKQGFCLLACLAMFFCFLLPGSLAEAASATIRFETEPDTVDVGGTITLSILVKSDVYIGDFEAYLTYDEEVMEYLEGPDCVSGGEGMLKITERVISSSAKTRKYILKFKAVSKGYSEFSLSGRPEVYEFENGYLMSISSGTAEVEVNAPQEASDNARLETLKISPGKLKPDFQQDVFEYNTLVGAGTDQILISAIPNDLNASVAVTGDKELKTGQNRIVILVTAENGAEQKYIIYAVKKEKEEEPTVPKETEEPEDTAAAAELPEDQEGKKAVLLAAFESGVVSLSGSFYYMLAEPPEEAKLPDGNLLSEKYKKTSMLISGIKIPAYAPKDSEEGDYMLLYLKAGDGEPGFYHYDRDEQTIQRLRGVNARPVNSGQPKENQKEAVEALAAEYKESLSKMWIAVVVLSAVCAILLIGVIRFYMKSRGMQDDLD